MTKKIIPIKIEEFSVSRQYNKNDKENEGFELDFNNIKTEVVTKNQYIRGVLEIPIKGQESISFLGYDKIYTLDENKEFVEKHRKGDELIDNRIYGRFQYTKSLGAMDMFRFNREIDIHIKFRRRLQTICSNLIYEELELQKRNERLGK